MNQTETAESVRQEYHDLITDQSLDGFYRNYGDANPEYHGGIWIAYDVDRRSWDVWITSLAYEVGLHDTDHPGVQLVEAAEIHFSDVVADDGTWTDTFDHIPDTYHRGHRDPIGAVVDRELTAYVAHEARKWADPYPYRGQPVEEHNYEHVLDRFGIEPRDEL
jgi:hypothetical protein